MMMRDEAFLLQKVKDLKISSTHNIHLLMHLLMTDARHKTLDCPDSN